MSTRQAYEEGMAFTSMILSRTLSAGHAWLSKRVGRSKNRRRGSVAVFKTKNDMP